MTVDAGHGAPLDWAESVSPLKDEAAGQNVTLSLSPPACRPIDKGHKPAGR